MARPPERLFRLVFEPHDGRALSADSEEKREPARDIETATVESLKVLDTRWPIREADITSDPNLAGMQPIYSAFHVFFFTERTGVSGISPPWRAA